MSKNSKNQFICAGIFSLLCLSTWIVIGFWLLFEPFYGKTILLPVLRIIAEAEASLALLCAILSILDLVIFGRNKNEQ